MTWCDRGSIDGKGISPQIRVVWTMTRIPQHTQRTGSSFPSIASLVRFRLYFFKFSPFGTASGLTHADDRARVCCRGNAAAGSPPRPRSASSAVAAAGNDVVVWRRGSSDDNDDGGRRVVTARPRRALLGAAAAATAIVVVERRTASMLGVEVTRTRCSASIDGYSVFGRRGGFELRID